MRSTARCAAATAAAVLVAGLVTALPTSAAAEEAAPVPPFVDSWLVLTTGSDNAVTWYDREGTLLSDQEMTPEKNCALGTTPTLLDFAGAPSDRPGLRDGSIGVREKGKANGVSCGQVDSAYGESLTLELGSTVTGEGLAAVAASLDVDLKQNAAVLATATYGDLSSQFALLSGSADSSDVPAGAVVTPCNADSADSGTDNGVNDNCRWPIGDASTTGSNQAIYFDSLTLTALSGSFSLEGGADGAVGVGEMPDYIAGSTSVDDGYGSVIELAQVLDCGQTAPTFSGTGVSASSWQRLDDRSTEACTPYAYTSEAGTDDQGPFAHFRLSPDAADDAQAVWSTQFPYSGPVPDLRFAFDAPDGSAGPFVTPDDCADVGIEWDGQTLMSPGDPTPDESGNFACLLSTTTGNSKGDKTVTFTVYVLGDAWMRR
jgi:hypothetical protein